MSTSPLASRFRAAERVVRTNSSRAAERISHTTSYRAAERVVRGHSRTSVIAASAAAAAVLGTAGFAVGAAPWAEAASSVTATAQVQSHPASGQPGSFLFNAISGTKTPDGKTTGGIRLDGLQAAAAAANKAASHPAPKAPAAAHPAKPAKPAAAKPAAVRKPAAKPRVAPKPPAAPAKPYLIYDSVKPWALPKDHKAAVYATGHYKANPASLGGRTGLLWIDTKGYTPKANVLDVEPGDATPYRAGQWVKARLSANPHAVAIVYTMRSEWGAVQDQMSTLPSWMHSKIRYWIADPTGSPHVVPGSSATQWYWGNNYDISTATPNFER